MDDRRLQALALRILYRSGCDSGVAGHLSMRTPSADAYWINPWGVFWDEITGDDFVRVDFTLQGPEDPARMPSLGSGFHAAIYRRRPDVQVVCHSHAPYASAVACSGRPLGMFDQRAPMFLDDMAVFGQETVERTEGSGLYFGIDEAELMADALGQRRALLLAHHGVITVAGDLGTAVVEHIFFEECCRTQVFATALGAPVMPRSAAESLRAAGRKSGRRVPATWQALLRRARRTDPELFDDGDPSPPDGAAGAPAMAVAGRLAG